MAYRDVTFTGSKKDSLQGRLELPTGIPPRAYALFAHCFTCGMNLKSATLIARALTQKGIAVLRFDFTGLGKSEGDFGSSTFSSDVQDLVAAANFLKTEFEAPTILIGHSLGGTAALMAAAEMPSVVAVATIGSPADPEHVKHLFDWEKIEKEGAAEVTIAGRSFMMKKEFFEDLKAQPMGERLSKLRKALLILHAPQDELVSIDNAGMIFQAAKHPKSFVSLDQADHLLTRKQSAVYVAEVIAGWSSQYLPVEKIEPTNKVTVRIGSEGFLSTIQSGAHRLLADEPQGIGGENLGPSPYDYLGIALGSCTAMTLRMYAGRKKWPLEEVIVEIDHEKEHITDCEDCEESGKKIDHFERTIAIKGDLDETQRARLLDIADKCPVHKTLEAASRVSTKEKI